MSYHDPSKVSIYLTIQESRYALDILDSFISNYKGALGFGEEIKMANAAKRRLIKNIDDKNICYNTSETVLTLLQANLLYRLMSKFVKLTRGKGLASKKQAIRYINHKLNDSISLQR